MSKSRRMGAMVAMVGAAIGVAAGTSATPAVAEPLDGPQPVSTWLRAVKAHSDSWVNISWRTSAPICDVKVRVAGRGVAVSYPGHRRFTSFSRGDMLRPSRPDYTAISVDPDFTRSGVARLKATIAFDNCGRHARTQYRSFGLALPVLRNHGWPGHGHPGWPGPGQPAHPGWPAHHQPAHPGTGNPGTASPSPGTGTPGNGGDGHGAPHPAGSASPSPTVTSRPVTPSSPAAAPSAAGTPATTVNPGSAVAPSVTGTPGATSTRPGGAGSNAPVHH